MIPDCSSLLLLGDLKFCFSRLFGSRTIPLNVMSSSRKFTIACVSSRCMSVPFSMNGPLRFSRRSIGVIPKLTGHCCPSRITTPFKSSLVNWRNGTNVPPVRRTYKTSVCVWRSNVFVALTNNILCVTKVLVTLSRINQSSSDSLLAFVYTRYLFRFTIRRVCSVPAEVREPGRPPMV